MEAPKKIYVTKGMLFMTNPEITLQGNGNEIEYTRTDVFIDKACEWIKKRWSETDYRFHEDFTGMLVGDFKKHMKGE